jgi:hypothetical protein
MRKDFAYTIVKDNRVPFAAIQFAESFKQLAAPFTAELASVEEIRQGWKMR